MERVELSGASVYQFLRNAVSDGYLLIQFQFRYRKKKKTWWCAMSVSYIENIRRRTCEKIGFEPWTGIEHAVGMQSSANVCLFVCFSWLFTNLQILSRSHRFTPALHHQAIKRICWCLRAGIFLSRKRFSLVLFLNTHPVEHAGSLFPADLLY